MEAAAGCPADEAKGNAVSRMRFGFSSIDDEIEDVEQQIVDLALRLAELKAERVKERADPRPSDCLTAEEVADIERD